MSQTWLGAEAGLVTCSMQCALEQKRGKLVRNGQKGQRELSHLLIGGPKGEMLKYLQPAAAGGSAPCSLGTVSVTNRERGPYTSLPCPTPYLKQLMDREGLNSLCKYPGGCVLHTLQCLSIIALCWLFFIAVAAVTQ